IYFFFQAEDGIRDYKVTGVQTCALPIYRDWSNLLVNTTKDIATSVLALPSEVKKFLARAQRGELEVRFRGIDEHARLIYGLGHRSEERRVGKECRSREGRDQSRRSCRSL